MKKIWIILFGLFLVTFCFESRADETQQPINKSLEQTCEKLSEGREHEYHAISVEVIKSGVVPPVPVDCVSEKCRELQKNKPPTTWFYAYAEFINKSPSDKQLSIHTMPEPIKDLWEKPPYMESGKKYNLCARGPEPYLGDNSKVIYKIDHVDTIQEIK